MEIHKYLKKALFNIVVLLGIFSIILFGLIKLYPFIYTDLKLYLIFLFLAILILALTYLEMRFKGKYVRAKILFVSLFLISVFSIIFFLANTSEFKNSIDAIGITEKDTWISRCSMVHYEEFESWWEHNKEKYVKFGISKEQFKTFPFRNGIDEIFTKIVPATMDGIEVGDVVAVKINDSNVPVWASVTHRVVYKTKTGSGEYYIGTMGDNNPIQSEQEFQIWENDIKGKVERIPFINFLHKKYDTYFEKCNSYISEDCKNICFSDR